MFANTKALAVIAACVVIAQAQTTTGTAPASQSSLPAGLDTCILGCVTQAATANGCASFTDLACVCTSTAFQGAALACLQANCTAEDLATATQLQSQECAAFLSAAPSGSGSASASAAPTGSSASVAGSTTAAPAPAATTKNAATGSVPYSFQALFGALFASAGALIGGALVL